MTDNVEECREKFRGVLATITPQKVVSDDTFLEKTYTYLKRDGNFLFFCYHKASNFTTLRHLSRIQRNHQRNGDHRLDRPHR